MGFAGVSLLLSASLAMASAAGATEPDFSKDVAPILYKSCVKCHRPGEIASKTPLLKYETVRPWAKAIKEKVLLREMPPWPADANNSVKFRNDARLSQRDIDTLVAWVNAGAPKGKDAGLPPAPTFAQGWLHPMGLAPDVVISLREFQAPAKGEIPYLRYLAKVPFPEDKWVVASQVRPGNRALMHHMAITEVALDDRLTPADLDRVTQVARQLGFSNGINATRPAVAPLANPALSDMLAVYTPGTTLEIYGNSSAKLLKGGKNYYLNFNIHYQATGKPETDRSLIAFWFQPGPPKHELFRVPASGETIIAEGRQLLTDAPGTKAEGTHVAIPPIPPYAENYEVIGMTAYTEPVTIYQFQPHAHLRGKDFKYAIVYPDGREETVLCVPKYDFNWQLAYDLDTPLNLPAGSKLVVTAHYDNSLKNRYNPAPEKEVYFHEENQSWDEMFTPFIQYTIDSQNLTKGSQPQPRQAERADAGQPNVLAIIDAVGCLEQNPSGTWMLTNVGNPITSTIQTTSSLELRAAASTPLGNRRYQLLGVSGFRPSIHLGQKIAVKGVEIKGRRLNVTSLQMLASTCF